MIEFDDEVGIAQVRRVLVVVVLLLALLGGTGVVAADGEPGNGSACPGVTHERGSDFAPEIAFERSSHGRSTALIASGCA